MKSLTERLDGVIDRVQVLQVEASEIGNDDVADKLQEALDVLREVEFGEPNPEESEE